MINHNNNNLGRCVWSCHHDGMEGSVGRDRAYGVGRRPVTHEIGGLLRNLASPPYMIKYLDTLVGR
jgi:hypothetical protein